jgi:hypothetical protein
MSRRLSTAVATLTALLIVLLATDAQAIPAFARQTKLGCNTCHTIFPQLTRFGRDFRDNGFRTPDEVQQLLHKSPVQAPPAPKEDFWSFVPEQIPFSVQAKLHDAINPQGTIKTDFQLEELQLQSGGTFTPRVSYYLHHHLVEEGQPGTLYAGWIRFNDLWGTDWVNVTVGQFELPLSFSPEIERLSSFEYLAYGRQLGANPFTLGDPQLGVQVFGQSTRGTKVWGGVVNGSGLSRNDTTQSFDSNTFKDGYARICQEIGESYFGGFVYYGRATATLSDVGTFDDSFVRAGGDGSLSLKKVIVSGVALYGRDNNPLGIGERRTFSGGFVEGDVFLTDRTVVIARVDAVHQSQPAIFGSTDDGDSALFRVNTVAFTPGIQWLVLPNVKLGFEYQVRQSRDEDRALAQLHMSF